MKSTEQRKFDIERMFRAIGVQPVERTKIGNDEVFIADGFVPPKIIEAGFLKKFEINPGEFTFGVYLTLWWTERFRGMGSIAAFDAFHDPGYSKDEKQQLRVNTAIHLAKKYFEKQKMH